jgi:hypothetical protein
MTTTGFGLHLAGVQKTYSPGNAEPITAVDDVSLDLAAGDTAALTGPSGSGKSTLLHLAARRRLWGFCGDLGDSGWGLRHGTAPLPAFMQVRGLTTTALDAPRPRLERGTYRLGGFERGHPEQRPCS